MNLEKEVRKIVDEVYAGDSDKLLISLKNKTISFLLVGGSSLILSTIMYKSGITPIITSIIGGVFMIIGMISHNLYNKIFKILNKD
jgi:hypothetical protein